MFGLGTTELVILAVIIVIIFGTGKLRHIGSDFGGAISDFRRSITDAEDIEEELHNIAKDIEGGAS